MTVSNAWAFEVQNEINALNSLVSEHEAEHTLNETYYEALNRIKGMERALEIARKYGEV